LQTDVQSESVVQVPMQLVDVGALSLDELDESRSSEEPLSYV
jgi:hypothetical protein